MYINKILSSDERCNGMITLSEVKNKANIGANFKKNSIDIKQGKNIIRDHAYIYQATKGKLIKKGSLDDISKITGASKYSLSGALRYNDNEPYEYEGWTISRKLQESKKYKTVWNGGKEYHKNLTTKELIEITGIHTSTISVNRFKKCFIYKGWLISKEIDFNKADLKDHVDKYISKDGRCYFGDFKQLHKDHIYSLSYSDVIRKIGRNEEFTIDDVTIYRQNKVKEDYLQGVTDYVEREIQSSLRVQKAWLTMNGQKYSARDFAKKYNFNINKIKELTRNYDGFSIYDNKVTIDRILARTMTVTEPNGKIHKECTIKEASEIIGISTVTVNNAFRDKKDSIQGFKIKLEV